MIKLFIAFIFLSSVLSYSQVNHFKAYQTTLQHEAIGKEYSFNRTRNDNHDSLVVVYLGKILTNRGRVLKSLSRGGIGSSPQERQAGL
jgi:hypothetical protein